MTTHFEKADKSHIEKSSSSFVKYVDAHNYHNQWTNIKKMGAVEEFYVKM